MSSFFISPQIVQHTCVFKGDTQIRCSNDTNMIIFCSKHGDLFNLNTIKETLISGVNKSKFSFTSLKFTDVPKYFLPFPFKFDETSKKFCLIVEEMNKFQSFSSSESNQKLIPYMKYMSTLLTDGQIFTVETRDININSNLMNFTQSPDFINKIDSRWEGVNITVLSGAVLRDFPMTSLPLFYKILLYFTEISSVCIRDNRVSATRIESHKAIIARSPNILLNLDSKYFEIINNRADQPLFILADQATYASSVMLLGKLSSDTSNQHVFYEGGFGGTGGGPIMKFPNLC